MSAETDLGDIVLTPLVVSGTIRDASGQPVHGATVDLDLDKEPFVEMMAGFSIPRASCDALGRFELRQRTTDTSVGLTARAQGFASSPKQFVPVGASGVEIVLERAGSIAGRLAPGSPEPYLKLFAAGQPVKASVRHAKEGAFSFHSVPPGAVTLTASYPWSEGQLDVPGLVVVAGEETRDPRLEPLDFASTLPAVTLTVVDDRGQPVPKVRVSLVRPGSEKFVECSPGRKGDSLVVSAGPLPLHVRLEAKGYRPQELTGVDSDRTVVLERGIPVRIVFSGTLPVLPEGWELEASLVEAGKRWSPYMPFSVADFEWAPGSAEVHLSQPGSYTLTHRLVHRRAGEILWQTGYPSAEGSTLEVVDGPEPQAFEVSLPSETLSEILAYIEESE